MSFYSKVLENCSKCILIDAGAAEQESNKSLENVMSTRLKRNWLFSPPKKITGAASTCCIVCVSPSVICLNENEHPRAVFVSLFREHSLQLFVEKVLPLLKKPVTLLTGSEDCTFPHGDKDVRYDRRYTRSVFLSTLVAHPMIARIFSENLDTNAYSHVHPLPLGLVTCMRAQYPTLSFEPVDLSARMLKCFLCHRTRTGGGQWNERERVNRLARTPAWRNLVSFYAKLPKKDFVTRLKSHVFCVCVQGGGVDPSPRAWEAIMAGCIPIICASTVSRAYEELPVVIVPRFDAETLSLPKLESWLARLRLYYENGGQRKRVVDRLFLRYWAAKYLHENTEQNPFEKENRMCVFA